MTAPQNPICTPCDTTDSRSKANRFWTTLAKTVSAEENSAPNRTRKGAASSTPSATRRARPPRGSSLHCTSCPTRTRLPASVPAAVVTPARRWSRGRRAAMRSPWRLAAPSASARMSPRMSNCASASAARRMNAAPSSSTVSASQGVSGLGERLLRRTRIAPAATRATAQSVTLRPHGIARSRVSPAIPSARPAASVSSPSFVRAAIIRPPGPATRRSGVRAPGNPRARRRDRRPQSRATCDR